MNIIKNKFVVILLTISAALSVCTIPTFAFAGTDQHSGSGGGGGGGQPWYASDINDLWFGGKTQDTYHHKTKGCLSSF